MKDKAIGELEFAGIDFESAGARKGETDEPVQVGIVVGTMRAGVTDHFISYIKPEKEVMWQASRVHGIKTEDLQDAPAYLSLWGEIRSRLEGRIIVAHSCGTEKRFLKRFPGHTFGPWVDSLLLARASLPDISSHKLEALKPYMGEGFQKEDYLQDRQWHDALYDAAASFYFLMNLVEELDLYDFPLSTLLQPSTQKYHARRHS